MLHEILLSLSGHPSALFEAKEGKSVTDQSIDFPLLSPPEQALLQTIGRLSRLHRDIRGHGSKISSTHASTICRAVATAITTTQLSRFQQTILDVEKRILAKDAGSVGAYNIVPLAGIVSEFDEWTRRLEWFWQLVCFMLPQKATSTPSSGAAIIDKLREESLTGYPDIEQAALELSKVAETAWLRQLSTWILYGRLPLVGKGDFFIQTAEPDVFEAVSNLAPKFVSRDTSSSILFIGKSLHNIRIRGPAQGTSISHRVVETTLLPVHLQYLSSLAFPLSSSALTNAVTAIRLSLSRNTLQQLLPLSSILQVLTLLRDFFLLRRGEFATALINEADTCLRNRNNGIQAPDNIKAILIKEAELSTILTKTLSAISNNTFDEDADLDSSIDFAREMLRLKAARTQSTRPSTPDRARETQDLPSLTDTTFNDFLLPTPVSLTMDISTPFDLFLTPAEINIYAHLQSYLLSLRRAHMRLCDLWRRTGLRRMHTSVQTSAYERGQRRHAEMRITWATCASGVFLLGEMGNYFEGEVIDEAWACLRGWIEQGGGDTNSDPAVLSEAHRRFLGSLAKALLLTEAGFTRALRDVLSCVDALVALVARLEKVQEALDLEEDEGVFDVMGDYAQEEGEVKRELGRARKRVDGALKEVVGRLREVGQGYDDDEELVGEEGAFVPVRGAGVERLLMRLEGQRRNGEDEGEDDS